MRVRCKCVSELIRMDKLVRECESEDVCVCVCEC